MHPNYYMNKITGEIVFTHKEAVDLYTQGYDVVIWTWSEYRNEYCQCLVWAH